MIFLTPDDLLEHAPQPHRIDSKVSTDKKM